MSPQSRRQASESTAYPAITAAEVANRFASRRKGTLHLLEELLSAIGRRHPKASTLSWLNWTQNMNYLHLDRDLTQIFETGDALENIGSAFDWMARNVVCSPLFIRAALPGDIRDIPEGPVYLIGALKSIPLRKTRCVTVLSEEESPRTKFDYFRGLGNDTAAVYKCKPQSEPQIK